MNVCGVTFRGYLAKILSFKSGNLLYKSNFYLLSEATVEWRSDSAQPKKGSVKNGIRLIGNRYVVAVIRVKLYDKSSLNSIHIAGLFLDIRKKTQGKNSKLKTQA